MYVILCIDVQPQNETSNYKSILSITCDIGASIGGFNLSGLSMNRLNKTEPAMHCFSVCSVVSIDRLILFISHMV